MAARTLDRALGQGCLAQPGEVGPAPRDQVHRPDALTSVAPAVAARPPLPPVALGGCGLTEPVLAVLTSRPG